MIPLLKMMTTLEVGRLLMSYLIALHCPDLMSDKLLHRLILSLTTLLNAHFFWSSSAFSLSGPPSQQFSLKYHDDSNYYYLLERWTPAPFSPLPSSTNDSNSLTWLGISPASCKMKSFRHFHVKCCFSYNFVYPTVGGGAWPFLVGGVICLVNSDNKWDSVLL